MARESSLLAGICGASVLGRIATGRRAGQPVLRVGRIRDAPLVTLGGQRQAHASGFDLHANVAVPAGDRVRLEHLARYVLRPPVAQDALELMPDGKILLKMRRAWHDGTRAVLFHPHELIEKLAALVPGPRINLLLYHGALGPSARLRSRAVAAARSLCALERGDGEPARKNAPSTRPGISVPGLASMPPGHSIGGSPPIGPNPVQPPGRSRSEPRPHTPWAELLRRMFEIDVLACPDCGGRLRFIATIEDPAVVRRILTHLGIPTERPEPYPARSPPGLPALFDQQPE